MDNQARTWNILNWNIRGLNSDDKCNAVRSKIEESSCVIYCLQETKRQIKDVVGRFPIRFVFSLEHAGELCIISLIEEERYTPKHTAHNTHTQIRTPSRRTCTTRKKTMTTKP
jgi:hypothetical protein